MWKAEGAKSWNSPPWIRNRQGSSAKQAGGSRLIAIIVVEPALPMSQR